MNLEYLNKNFKYTADKGWDNWKLMKMDGLGFLRGDCEDYSLWIAFYLLANESWYVLFWKLLTREIKFHFVRVKHDNGGHCVLEYDGKFIDNWNRKWVSKKQMERTFKFKHRIKIPIILAKLCFGLFK